MSSLISPVTTLFLRCSSSSIFFGDRSLHWLADPNFIKCKPSMLAGGARMVPRTPAGAWYTAHEATGYQPRPWATSAIPYRDRSRGGFPDAWARECRSDLPMTRQGASQLQSVNRPRRLGEGQVRQVVVDGDARWLPVKCWLRPPAVVTCHYCQNTDRMCTVNCIDAGPRRRRDLRRGSLTKFEMCRRAVAARKLSICQPFK